MLAAVLEAKLSPVVVREYEDPEPSPGEVIVKLSYSALNHRDVWIQKGMYAGLKYPIIVGSDGAGEIIAVGDDVSKSELGRMVLLNPSLNWGSQQQAQNRDYKILGLPDNGTLAEYITIPFHRCYQIPDGLSSRGAAALPLAGLTAWRALISRAQAQPKEKVLISGAGGGVALFALQFAVALGCEVWVTSGSEEKIQQAISLGAKGGVNYKMADWEKKLLQQSGPFQVVIDGACGDGFAKLIEIADMGGRISIYGGTAGNIPAILPAKIFWKQLSVFGSTMGSDQDFEAMLHFVGKHRVEPIIAREFELADAETAFRFLDNGSQFGKVILKNS